LVAPVRIPDDMVARDWVALIGSAALLLLFAWTGKRVGRLEALLLLALYGAYAWLLIRT
jgi:Ca2+/Na+ antiporter